MSSLHVAAHITVQPNVKVLCGHHTVIILFPYKWCVPGKAYLIIIIIMINRWENESLNIDATED